MFRNLSKVLKPIKFNYRSQETQNTLTRFFDVDQKRGILMFIYPCIMLVSPSPIHVTDFLDVKKRVGELIENKRGI